MNIITEFIKILELKRYSKQTLNSYKGHLLSVRKHFNHKSFKTLSNRELFEFIYHLVNTKEISASYQRQIVGALKLFYKELYYLGLSNHFQLISDENILKIPISDNLIVTFVTHTY